MGDSGITYIYEETHWKIFHPGYVKSFAQDHFDPPANNAKVSEFLALVGRTNLEMPDWFPESTTGKMNFKNGVLDIDSGEFLPHDPKYGFKYCLPYEYKPLATAPRFQQFMKEITLDRKELIDVLLEYAGYCFSNEDPSWGEKALLLTGEGSNGKSVFLDVMRKLAGKGTYCSLNMKDLKLDTHRVHLDGSLFNVSEETPRDSFFDSSLFKNLVTGGDIVIKVLYQQPYEIKNYCKLLVACNELPTTRDNNDGTFRRLIICPFEAKFTPGVNRDPDLRGKLYAELPGIFNLLIENYKILRKRGRFPDSKILREHLQKYKEISDPLEAWHMERVVYDKELKDFVSTHEMFKNYAVYCEQTKSFVMPYLNFSKKLPYVFKNTAKALRKPVDGKKIRGYKGIRILDDSEY